MKVLLSLMVFFCFAVMFGVALVTTKWNGRREYEPLEDESLR